jgi:hypothetical protein
MIPILADSSPSPAMIGNILLVGLLILSGASTVVSLVSLFATRREVEALNKELDAHKAETRATDENLFAKLGGMERGLRGEFRGELETLRNEIGDAARSVSSLSATVTALNQSLISATGRLDRLADRKD